MYDRPDGSRVRPPGDVSRGVAERLAIDAAPRAGSAVPGWIVAYVADVAGAADGRACEAGFE